LEVAVYRTHYCGELTEKEIGENVTLSGWVNSTRDHGGVIFVDLRDRTGIVQIVFNPQINPDNHQIAQTLKDEDVITVVGRVERRPEGTENPKLKTGMVEVTVESIKVLNRCKGLPFTLDTAGDVSEDLRLKYRYIDLRREEMQRNFIIRHKIYQSARKYLVDRGFVEIETPMLTKSTPEGARDYLVPSRLYPGKFYALPQSPQLFKQILMVAGFEQYFQIVKCFRDEDLRADRQPEFTQVDIEASFVTREDILQITEGLMKVIFKDALNIKVSTPFPRYSYQDVLERFGTDKPDTRWTIFLYNITELAKDTEFQVFKKTIEDGGIVKALWVEDVERFSRI